MSFREQARAPRNTSRSLKSPKASSGSSCSSTCAPASWPCSAFRSCRTDRRRRPGTRPARTRHVEFLAQRVLEGPGEPTTHWGVISIGELSQLGPAPISNEPEQAMDVNLPLPLLGGLSPGTFMRRHWQKQAPADPPGDARICRRCWTLQRACWRWPNSPRSSRAWLSGRRLRTGGRMRQGPFARRVSAAPRKQANWTLLVQGVDLHVERGAHRLLSRFRFVPDARLDDRDGQLRDRPAVASARMSTVTTSSCCRRMAGVAGVSGGRRT
jgi:hypothetical protein